MTKILITGGHHNSALPLIDYINATYPNQYKFIWIGNKYAKTSKNISPEYIEVTKRNIDFYTIKTGKLFRTTSFAYVHKVIINLLLIPVGFLEAMYINLKIRPDIIMSFGGYIAVPIAYTGFLIGIRKIYTHEQTAVIGLANSLISIVSKKVLVAWPKEFYTSSKLSGAKIDFVGLPLKNVNQKSQIKIINFTREAPILLVTGGKLGSKYINSLIKENLDYLAGKVNIVWATGTIDGEFSPSELAQYIAKKEYAQNVIVRDYFYEQEMIDVLQNTDMAISRAGAHTMYEYTMLKIPCILIPIPWASNHEQLKNAQILESLKLAEIIEEENFSKVIFAEAIDRLIARYKDAKNLTFTIDLPKDPAYEITRIILRKNNK